MNLRIVSTSDQSHTIYVPGLNESYHSTHGAIRESKHIFIEAGLLHLNKGTSICVLEIGFGTGLNALLTQIEAETMGKQVLYTAIEAFPLEEEIWSQLNYPSMLCSIDYSRTFEKLHLADWGKTEVLSNFFSIHKIHIKLQDYSPEPNQFDAVYFDAFSPAAQPELWTTGIFMKLYPAMKPGAVLTTYSVKGDVIRSMKAAGFTTEKIPGPPGKRQITRAVKPI
ncbi:MAG: tRNA (5-methylaminomethyl-2-thiouridine)(34)-methyltransferase MnmD [Bacteroidetes bacterium]|nr:tRNA (5-methylaminomethyl-2-thiouridine)(34)-methyltransferase MnmD [Bacteroidota bacterium]